MEGDRENYRNYIYRPNSFEPLAMTCHHSFEYDYYQEHRHTDRTLPVKQKPEIYWYQNDHLGTPHCLTDAHGQAVWKSSYLAFGSIKTEANNGAGIDNPLRFAGQYHDRETRLFYNLNRYYDPTMKRYLTQDPVGLAGGLNSYLYVDANPISRLDPLGLFKQNSTGLENSTINSEEPSIPPLPNDYDPIDWNAVVPKKGPYKGQPRSDHVRLHNQDNPIKDQHGVFYEDGVDLTNEAWEKAAREGLKPDAGGTLSVSFDKLIGRAGGKASNTDELFYSVEIKLVPFTNQIITSYPVK